MHQAIYLHPFPPNKFNHSSDVPIWTAASHAIRTHCFLYKSSLILRAVSGASWAVKMKHPANCSICFREFLFIVPDVGIYECMVVPIHCIQMGTVQRLSNSSWAFTDEASVKVLPPFDYCLGRLTASKDLEISPESFPEELLQTIACLSKTGQNPFQRLRSKLCR